LRDETYARAWTGKRKNFPRNFRRTVNVGMGGKQPKEGDGGEEWSWGRNDEFQRVTKKEINHSGRVPRRRENKGGRKPRIGDGTAHFGGGQNAQSGKAAVVIL